MSILSIKKKGMGSVIIETELPQGKTQGELIELAIDELTEIQNKFFGKKVLINGRITTGMALAMGHFLAHISREVLIFDPKLNEYVSCVKH